MSWFVGLVFIFAGSAKLFSASPASGVAASLGIPDWVSSGVIPSIEIMLGCWLCSGLYKKAASAIGSLMLIIFVSATLMSKTASSCGCFGSVSLPLHSVIIVDIILLAMLGLQRLRDGPPQSISTVCLRSSGAIVMGLLCVAATEGRFPGASLGSERLTTLLRPRDWVGKRFPLVDNIEGEHEFMRGDWEVVLYHDGCDRCEEAMPFFEAQAREGRSIALVELPPYGAGTRRIIQDPSACVLRKLSPGREWIVETPTVIYLKEGVVQPPVLVGAGLEALSRDARPPLNDSVIP